MIREEMMKMQVRNLERFKFSKYFLIANESLELLIGF